MSWFSHCSRAFCQHAVAPQRHELASLRRELEREVANRQAHEQQRRQHAALSTLIHKISGNLAAVDAHASDFATFGSGPVGLGGSAVRSYGGAPGGHPHGATGSHARHTASSNALHNSGDVGAGGGVSLMMGDLDASAHHPASEQRAAATAGFAYQSTARRSGARTGVSGRRSGGGDAAGLPESIAQRLSAEELEVLTASLRRPNGPGGREA